MFEGAYLGNHDNNFQKQIFFFLTRPTILCRYISIILKEQNFFFDHVNKVSFLKK